MINNSRKNEGTDKERGKMWVFGDRWEEKENFYGPTHELAQHTSVAETCKVLSKYMKKEFKEEWEDIRKVLKEKKKTIPNELGGEDGVSCSLVISEDLGNSRLIFFFSLF